MIVMKILMITIQESPPNIDCFDDMIADMLCNKNLKQ